MSDLRKNVNTHPESKLTVCKMRELFGVNYHHILYYNHDTGKFGGGDDKVLWSAGRPSFERVLVRLHWAKENMIKMAECLDKYLAQYDMKLAASVVMAVNKNMKLGEVVENPQYHKNVCDSKDWSLVGTIVTRDKSSGKINNTKQKWMCFNSSTIQDNYGFGIAARDCIENFVGIVISKHVWQGRPDFKGVLVNTQLAKSH